MGDYIANAIEEFSNAYLLLPSGQKCAACRSCGGGCYGCKGCKSCKSCKSLTEKVNFIE
ncbi:MAG: hypothetical protein QXL88_00240 [Candidatus Pacearchaeota archaeon]